MSNRGLLWETLARLKWNSAAKGAHATHVCQLPSPSVGALPAVNGSAADGYVVSRSANNKHLTTVRSRLTKLAQRTIKMALPFWLPSVLAELLLLSPSQFPPLRFHSSELKGRSENKSDKTERGRNNNGGGDGDGITEVASLAGFRSFGARRMVWSRTDRLIEVHFVFLWDLVGLRF